MGKFLVSLFFFLMMSSFAFAEVTFSVVTTADGHFSIVVQGLPPSNYADGYQAALYCNGCGEQFMSEVNFTNLDGVLAMTFDVSALDYPGLFANGYVLNIYDMYADGQVFDQMSDIFSMGHFEIYFDGVSWHFNAGSSGPLADLVSAVDLSGWDSGVFGIYIALVFIVVIQFIFYKISSSARGKKL